MNSAPILVALLISTLMREEEWILYSDILFHPDQPFYLPNTPVHLKMVSDNIMEEV